MYYKIVCINNDFDINKYKEFKKTTQYSKCRNLYVDCDAYKNFLSEFASRGGLPNLKEYLRKLGKPIYNKSSNKLYLLKDLELYDDSRLDNYINLLQRAQNRAYYQLLPLIIRPLGSPICNRDVCIIADGLERIQDNFDNASDFIIELLELCYHARDTNSMLYFETIAVPAFSSLNIPVALGFAINMSKTTLLPSAEKLLIGFKEKKNTK